MGTRLQNNQKSESKNHFKPEVGGLVTIKVMNVHKGDHGRGTKPIFQNKSKDLNRVLQSQAQVG
jgi:hypothetical protein